MRFRTRWWHALIIAVVGIGVAAFMLWPKPLVYPTPQTESAFFHQYSVEKAAAPFSCRNENSSFAARAGGGAGEHSATHWKSNESHIVIDRTDWMPLVQAVADDLAQQLRLSGAQLLDSSGDPRQGFHYQYTIGHTFGDAVIESLEYPDAGRHGGSALSPNQISAVLRVKIKEEWFKEKPGLISVRVEGHER